MNETPLCSVVIPTYNRASSLARCLSSLAGQSVQDFEIVVVDDGSTLETREAIERIVREHNHSNIRYIRLDKNAGCARARNTGIQAARGSIILFTDDDCEVPQEWVETLLDTYRRYPKAVGAGGWYWPSPAELSSNRYEQFYEALFESYFPRMRACEVWGNTMQVAAGNTANMSYRKDFLEDVGGFDETLYFTGGVDHELKARCIARGCSLVSLPLAVTHHKRLTLRSFISKSVKWGRGLDYERKKFRPWQGLTLSSLLTLYARRRALPAMKDVRSGVFALWGLCMLAGALINRVTGYRPKERHMSVDVRRFVYRFEPGVADPSLTSSRLVTSHEKVSFSYVPSVVAKKSRTTKSTRSAPLCSIVIPTFNRSEMMLCAVRSALDQSVSPRLYEIIVVDDGSSDGTYEAIMQLKHTQPEHSITYLYQENRGAALARNHGVEKARGNFIFFLDSDCKAPRRWLQIHLEAYRQHPDIVGAGGGILTTHPLARARDRLRNFFQDNSRVAQKRSELIKTNDTTLVVTAYDSANMSVRKDAFRGAGGFFPVGVGGMLAHEDIDFACRVQESVGPMALIPNAAVSNIRLMSWREFRESAYVRGFALPSLIARISPSAVNVCREPLFSTVAIMFSRCLLHPFRSGAWANAVYMYYYSAGYRDAMKGAHF